ncbi:hypothetical protein BH10ACI4_BH10ACI4_28260 [soil metagenome]
MIDGELPGRHEATLDVVKEMRWRTDPNGWPMIVQITGDSGCGKTSFLRAGVLAALTKSESDKFLAVPIRPTDFHGEDGLPDKQILSRLIEIIGREIHNFPLAPSAVRTVARAAGAQVIQAAVDALIAALNEKGPEWRLIIGLDQFEEILDDLANNSRQHCAQRWQRLLSFVALAARSGRFGFVYTLESSRRELFDKANLPGVFRQAYVQNLGGGCDSKFLEAVIRIPFQNAGHRLAQKIVNELIILFQKYSSKFQPQASALPLLALKLSNLFDTVQGLSKARPTGDKLQEQFDQQGAEISYEEVENELPFELEIEELASRAWGELVGDEKEQIYDVHFFLQPLVASSDEEDRITLQTVGENRLSTMRERLAAFEDVRLVIRDNGRLRLVHEAVVRQWSLAARWRERCRDFLQDVAIFRPLANKWHSLGEPESSLPMDAAAIDTAAAVLVSQIQNWPMVDSDQMSTGDQNLKRYCQAILRKNIDPSRCVKMGNLGDWGSQVHVAASYGEMSDVVGQMIEQEPSCIHLETRKKRTPLDMAAWGQPTTVRLLVNSNANAVHFDSEGWSTITAAIWQGNHEIFRVLQPHYVRAEDIAAPQQMSLLHVAARRGEADMAATLLSTVEGADPMKEDEWGRIPLDYAAIFEQPRTLAFFLEHSDVRHRSVSRGWTVLHWAASGGSLQALNSILKLDEFSDLIDSKDTQGRTALMIAAGYRHAAVAARLSQVLDVNQQCTESPNRGWTALHFAVAGINRSPRETRASRREALQTVRVLLQRPEVDPRAKNEEGEEPISLAGSLPQVRRELISHDSFNGSQRLTDGTTPLNYFIATNDRPAVERLLRRRDLDVEMLSSNGDYVLKLLITNDMTDLAMQLFEARRVNPWKVERVKDIGLAVAIRRNHEGLIEAYLDQLPMPVLSEHRHILANAARTALFQANVQTFERLMQLGADADLIDSMGWSLKHVAALLGDTTVFKKLDLTSTVGAAPDAWGRFPVDLAPDNVRDVFGREDLAHQSTRTEIEDFFSFSDGAWSVVEDTSALFEQIGHVIDGILEIDATVLVRRRSLPMYEHAQLVCLTSPKWKPNVRVCYLEDAGEFFRLNGSSPPIHEVNAKAPVRLTEENAGYYLSFFCLFVQGDEGPYYIIHNLSDELLPAGVASSQNAGNPPGRTLPGLFRRPKYLGKSDGGFWRFSTLVYYSDAIFLADFEVQPSGMVEMVDDQPLITDLPLRVSVNLTGRS